MPQKKCDLCGREFKSEQGLLQHFADKHPDARPPEEVVKKESLRTKRRNSSSTRSKSRLNKILVVSAVIIVIIVIASVGVYLVSPKPTSQSTTAVSKTSGVVYGINTGDYAPNLQITLTNGTSTTLQKFLDTPVLLYFVATWCPSCTQAAQLLNQQYYSELHAKGVTIVVVELYNDLGTAGPSIQQYANQYGGGTGKPGWFYGTSTQSATYTYDPSANLEAYYLINSAGQIIMTTGSAGLAGDLPNVVNAA